MKTIIVGFDAFDPNVFERLHEQGKMPNLGKFVAEKGYSRFTVSTPAQSEVSWTSIATGLNPGGHGMFDFVHRNPESYSLHVSLLPTAKTLVGTQFTQPHKAYTLFDYAVDNGYPATSLWWPATFPARFDSPIHSIPGLGAPDILGQLGVGVAYAPRFDEEATQLKTRLGLLHKSGDKSYHASLKGPLKKKGGQLIPAEVEFQLHVIDENSARIEIAGQRFELQLGQWSPVFEMGYKMGFGISIKSVTRVVIQQLTPEPLVYFLPLQMHPIAAAWPYASPRPWVKDTWKKFGPFLTLGWPQDTTALEEGYINDQQFLQLCDDINASREQIFMHQLENFNEGVLAIVFDTLDRIQHMFLRRNEDVIDSWYEKLDALLGRIVKKIAETGNQDAQLLVLSDHGFARFEHKANLNKLLLDEGFLATKANADAMELRSAQWDKSQAYAIGLNSIYLNLQGREGQGTVSAGDQETVSRKLTDALLKWQGPDGRKVVQNVYTREQVFSGPLAEYGPDLIVGYTPGYRASSDTGLGKWNENTLEPNNDHWEADHCIDPASVKGVLFSNRGLENWPDPGYTNIPEMAVGSRIKGKTPPPPPTYDEDEDQDVVEERLKGLGYL